MSGSSSLPGALGEVRRRRRRGGRAAGRGVSSPGSPAGDSASPGAPGSGTFVTPWEMKFRTSSRVTPWAASSCAACDRGCWSSAASTSPTPASSRPALWTWRTAAWRTRRKARVCVGSWSLPLGQRLDPVLEVPPKVGAETVEVDAAGPAGSPRPRDRGRAAKSRCSRVRCAWRRDEGLADGDVQDHLQRHVEHAQPSSMLARRGKPCSRAWSWTRATLVSAISWG